MNDQDTTYFKLLFQDRSEIADVLDRRAVRGYKDSVVEKYSDQAHFIYELLQNADDAYATKARFILEENRLIFAHNGSRHFSISDPNTEDVDSEIKTLGDINAITSIANSNKTSASIGKFGVGFKAVFQYTSTPHIYDPNFKFKIERFIVPTLLESDFPGRRPEETLFVFPFDHTERKSNEAYSDISNKLRSLSFPLLFLSNLKDIEFEYSNVIGLYGKRIELTRSFDDTIAEKICLSQNSGDEIYDKNMWMFSRFDECERRYSVGFFMDNDGHLCSINEPAFCFFPTKEVTGLNFILHAAFLLTDSREGIRAGVAHNDKLIKKLAVLAADSIVYLRDIGNEEDGRLIGDNVVDIIPYDPYLFSAPEDKRRVSFLPFYEAIKKKLSTAKLIPSTEGYVETKNAYWAAVPQLTQLFSNEQLADIVDNSTAEWVFVTLSRDEVQRNNKALFAYIESLVRTNLSEDVLISGRSKGSYYNRVLNSMQSIENIKGITESFILNQSYDWLNTFYKWLSETKHRTELVMQKPIFLDQNNKAVAAFDDDMQLILFLPVNDIEGYTVIHPELLNKPETKKFVEEIGIKQPTLKDQIYNIILPQYVDGEEIDTDPHFLLFFKYFCKCSHDEVYDFIQLIKNYEFVTYYENNTAYRGMASTMYIPTDTLVRYFKSKPSTRFVALDEYKKLVGSNQEKNLLSFLEELGAKTEPFTYSKNDNGYYHRESENLIDGLQELIQAVNTNRDADLSVFVWQQLCHFIKIDRLDFHALKKIIESRPDGRYRFHTTYEDSSTVNLLKTTAWLLNSDGEITCAANVTKNTLSHLYNIELEGAAKLITDILCISDPVIEHEHETDDESNLTQEQKEKIEFANEISALGISKEDLDDFREFKRQKEARKRASETASHRDENENNDDDDDIDLDELDESGLGDVPESNSDQSTSGDNKRKLDKATSRVVKDIIRRTKDKPSSPISSEHTTEEDTENDIDADEFTPVPIDYSKRIEKAKQKSAAEIDRITYFEELQTKAIESKKYSYHWFTTLLEMESINSGEANANSREVSISFAKVEKEPGTQRTLVLKHPNHYIPQFMEDLADIPLVLHMGQQNKTVAIEVVNIKSYTLRVKLKSSADVDSIDLSSVTMATIDAKSPSFLLEELRKQFLDLTYKDDFNMQENLCENIEFVFGPPGTGKTTHLAKNVLIPMMKENSDCKVLVLTPTNKSADVLVRRIMEESGIDHSYNDWLIRFGATGDEFIEQSPIYRDKTFDIRTLSKNVTVTTIARFPYDFFMPQGARIFLYGMNWDYIVIDEASMIPIANIVFPLYKKTPRKFIIAGDPFQIEPITSVDLWKNENIYTMVQLDSFVNPHTIPYDYKVDLLTTQYRSVPDIGHVFSNFAYGGILKHYRNADSQRPLNVGYDLGIETLNIIKFPVSKYESIYRCKRLRHSSSYQIYSVLFTFEYVCHLSRKISENNPGSLIKIGVIAPYRAQADLIDKLIASEALPKEVDVQVGTIHGFQGDECDIIFAVFNTPPTISSSNNMFLNKRNIINVSISRAKDYLFIIMPDDNTENISNLRHVRRVESLVRSTDAWNEFTSRDLEDLIFDDPQYLESNAFSTSHQNVNVYGLPEKCYEVRTEDTAVDVQIYKGLSQSPTIEIPPIINVVKSQKTETTINIQTSQSDILSQAQGNQPYESIEIKVNGRRNGAFKLIPYKGKLKTVTSKRAEAMFISQVRNGKAILVPVSIVDEDKQIFMPYGSFETYKYILDPAGVELRK